MCADPENLPFSNQKLEGFENKIAELLAKEFGAPLSYVWWGQRRGFIRNTMNATLKDGALRHRDWRSRRVRSGSNHQAVLPVHLCLCLSQGKGTCRSNLWTIRFSRRSKIGVHLLGDDYTNPPPVHELAKRGIVDNVVGFDTFYSAENPPSKIIDAVAAGKIGVAIVWGPAAGYFVGAQICSAGSGCNSIRENRSAVSPSISPWASGPVTIMLKAQLEKVLDRKQVEIQKILKDYGVPLLDRASGKAVPK